MNCWGADESADGPAAVGVGDLPRHDIENRAQLWSYRGPLAIHAATDGPTAAATRRSSTRPGIPRSPNCTVAEYGQISRLWTARGEILGVVDLVDVHPDTGCHAPWGESSYVEHGGRERRRIIHLTSRTPPAR